MCILLVLIYLKLRDINESIKDNIFSNQEFIQKELNSLKETQIDAGKYIYQIKNILLTVTEKERKQSNNLSEAE